MDQFNRKLIYGVIGLVLLSVLFLFFSPFDYNYSGYRTHVQTIGGKEFIRFQPGLYWSGFFAKETSYPDVVTVQFEDEKDKKEDISYFNDLITVQFNDATKAVMGLTVKWKLPTDESSMLLIHKDYRSPKRLAESLADYSKECANYSTQLIDSEYHYSGGKSKLRDDFQFQLRNGQYILEQKEMIFRDSITQEVTERRYVPVPVKNDDGTFKLSLSDVQAYNIVPNFVAITHFDYDEMVDRKLEAKIAASTQEAISKQKLITAQQEALTAKAEGDKQIALTRAREEAAKIEAVIQAEKETAVAKEQAKQAEYTADKIKWEKEAEAAANRALRNAGLDPLKEAELLKDTKIGIAQALAQRQVPTVMITGGGGGNGNESNTALDLVAIKALITLLEEIDSKTKLKGK